jgi:hypothetical protein
MDGYNSQELIDKYKDMEELYNHQLELNGEIETLTKEVNELPEVPYDLDKWADSLTDTSTKGFRLVDFKRLFVINKKYEKLIEERERNTIKMKSLVVDNLLNRIKEILDK